MAIRTEPSRPPRTPLSRERVLRAATLLANEGGIESVTMRRLARELGVEAMSLYHHVSAKDDILSGIVDIAVGEIDLPADAPDWKAALRACAVSAHRALLRHPWACGLMLSSTRVLPARLRYMDWVLGRLREAGFAAGTIDYAYHTLDIYITGFTLWQVNFPIDGEDLADAGATFLRQLPVTDYPDLAAHVRQHLAGSTDEGKSTFEFGLDLILDGLDGIRSAGDRG
jgi:AcrR family transcriptional regulator